MTNRSQSDQHATSEQRKVTAQLGRDQLEQALNRALAAGSRTLPRQVRYILALSQMTNVKPDSSSYPEKPLTIAEARLDALVELANMLTPDQLQTLLREILQIPDADHRLMMLARVATYMPESERNAIAGEVWSQARRLPDPYVRSQLYFQIVEFAPTHTAKATLSDPKISTVMQLANSIKTVEARIRSLVALARHLPTDTRLDLFDEILDEIDASENDGLRANTINTIAAQLSEDIEKRILRSALKIRNPAERARALTALARNISSALELRVGGEALDAISEISSEEDRVDALVAFAPQLGTADEGEDFPALLEQALTIAISFARRRVRARALVALASHLTIDLQGEALAAVNSLSSERERATLLAELAPTLPPDMLVASMAVAHTMREQDSRVHALAIMARYAPTYARSQTLLDALAAASNLPHHFERVTALLELVDVLPDHLRDQAFTNALETTRSIDNENARSRALSLLGQHLPDLLLQRATDMAFEINDHQLRLNALNNIIPRLDDKKRHEAVTHLLDSVRHIPFDYKQARALVGVAPQLTPELMPDAIKIADALADPYDQVTAYIALAQNIPPADRPEIIAKAKKLIAEIDDGYDRSSALAAITPFLPDRDRDELSEAAKEVIELIHDDYDRASAITILAPLLAYGETGIAPKTPDRGTLIHTAYHTALEIPQQTYRIRQLSAGIKLWLALDLEARYDLWQSIAKRMIRIPLSDVLLCLGALTPIFESLGDADQMKEIAYILGAR
jgi:hypothetical protein